MVGKPFGEEARAVMAEREISLREVSRRTQREKNWGAVSTLHLILSGQMKPTVEAMENIAAGLRVAPSEFAEYRLAMARRDLDPELVGIDRALRNLGE